MGNDLALLMAKLGLSPMTGGQALGVNQSPLNLPTMDFNLLQKLLQMARSSPTYNEPLMQRLRMLAQQLPQMLKQAPQAGPMEFGGMNALPFPVPQQLVQQLMQYMNPQG